MTPLALQPPFFLFLFSFLWLLAWMHCILFIPGYHFLLCYVVVSLLSRQIQFNVTFIYSTFSSLHCSFHIQPRRSSFHFHFISFQLRENTLLLFNSPRLSSIYTDYIYPYPSLHCTTPRMTRPRSCTACTYTHHTYIVPYPPLASTVILYRLAMV
jgi:hypothetical protein